MYLTFTKDRVVVQSARDERALFESLRAHREPFGENPRLCAVVATGLLAITTDRTGPSPTGITQTGSLAVIVIAA